MQDQRQEREERAERWRTWMVSAQLGDAAAYEKLLGQLLTHARAVVARRLSEPTAREEVVQNVLVAIHRARHTYHPERPFAPWLNAVMRNAVTDYLRRRARRARREVSVAPDRLPEPAVAPVLPGEEALSPRLERALAGLPEAQREAVLLTQVEGLSVAEAAARVGISRSALKVRAHRGYRALRARLGDKQ